jgi:uncharacterized protein YjbJ (UPF0337 family)
MADTQNTKDSGEASSANVNSATNDSASTNSASTATHHESPSETVKDTAKTVYEQAKGAANQALGAATDKAGSKIEEQKSNLSGGLSDVAGSLRKVGETLRDTENKNPVIDSAAKYGDQLAQRVEQISGYLEQKDLSEILRDTERFARRNPAIFIGGAMLLGFAAARFLKSSNPNRKLMLSSQNQTGSLTGESENKNQAKTGTAGATGGNQKINPS